MPRLSYCTVSSQRADLSARRSRSVWQPARRAKNRLGQRRTLVAGGCLGQVNSGSRGRDTGERRHRGCPFQERETEIAPLQDHLVVSQVEHTLPPEPTQTTLSAQIPQNGSVPPSTPSPTRPIMESERTSSRRCPSRARPRCRAKSAAASLAGPKVGVVSLSHLVV